MTVQAIDPATDLGDQHAAVGQRRIAVGVAQGAGRIMHAVPGATDRAHNALGAINPQHATIDDVRHLDLAGRKQIGVVGMRQIPRGASQHARVAIAPDDPRMAAERDHRNRIGELIVGRDVPAIRGDKRVIGLGQLRRGAQHREVPQDPLARVDDDHPVVVAVGDHQIARQPGSPRDRRHSQAREHRVATDQRGTPVRRRHTTSSACDRTITRQLTTTGRQHRDRQQHADHRPDRAGPCVHRTVGTRRARTARKDSPTCSSTGIPSAKAVMTSTACRIRPDASPRLARTPNGARTAMHAA